MTKQEYRQKVEGIIKKYNVDLYITIQGTTITKASLVDELVSLYEKIPGFPVTDKNRAIPGNGGVSKPDTTEEKIDKVITKEVMENAAKESNWLQVKTYYAEEIQKEREQAVREFVNTLIDNSSFYDLDRKVNISKIEKIRQLSEIYLSQTKGGTK